LSEMFRYSKLNSVLYVIAKTDLNLTICDI
jgi:hypothetical protein